MIEVAGPQLRDEANPEGDIEIEFVGLRDGEKLFEELLIGENVSTTAHDRIMRCDEYFPPRQYIEMELEELRRSLEAGDADLVRRVMRLATPPKSPPSSLLATECQRLSRNFRQAPRQNSSQCQLIGLMAASVLGKACRSCPLQAAELEIMSVSAP